jgi:hypothetical protein
LAAELHFQQRSHELINADARPGVILGRLVHGDGHFGALLAMSPKELFGREEPRQQSLKTLPSTWISNCTTKPNFSLFMAAQDVGDDGDDGDDDDLVRALPWSRRQEENGTREKKKKRGGLFVVQPRQ